MPHYSAQHYYSALQYSRLQCTTLTTPHRNYNYNCICNYTTLITQYNYNSTTPHYNYNYDYDYDYNYNYNCTTPHYIQQLWYGDHCNHCNHSKKHSSNHLSVHQWIRCAIRDSSPIGFLFLKLPPPPCAVLLVDVGYGRQISKWVMIIMIHIFFESDR